jgi:prephenate dehydrogenase
LRIAVVGSSGGMGSFFVGYFGARGHEVVRSDPVKRRQSVGTVARSNAEAASGSDAVLLAVPLWKTLEVAREVSGHMREGALLVDISSVKEPLLPHLERLSRERGISLLSVHPLFGPSLRRTEGMKLAVIGSAGSRPLPLARRLFPDAQLLPMTAEHHDRAMSVLLSLTHVTNMAYAAAASRSIHPGRFRALATPTASLQMTITMSVLAQDPELYTHILFENRHTRSALADLSREVRRMELLLARGDRKGFERTFRRLREIYGRDKASIRRIYEALGV